MAEALNDDRIRMFYVHSTAWVMPGAYKDKPKREARLAVVRERQAAEFDAWLEEHDRRIAHETWEACSARWVALNPGVPVVPEESLCCVGEHYCDSASSPRADEVTE